VALDATDFQVYSATNDSSTIGPVRPEPTSPGPLEGRALNQFLQAWLVGMTGIDPTLIRPRWQAEPANIPAAGQYWVAFGITKRINDAYVHLSHDPTANGGLGADMMIRHETIETLTSFFDLGVNGQADYFASILKDGLQIPQNREVLDRNAFGLVSASELTIVPTLFKERWQYRVDLAIILRREVRRIYPIRNVLAASIEVVPDYPLDPPPFVPKPIPPVAEYDSSYYDEGDVYGDR
jgi:hypothetical protein